MAGEAEADGCYSHTSITSCFMLERQTESISWTPFKLRGVRLKARDLHAYKGVQAAVCGLKDDVAGEAWAGQGRRAAEAATADRRGPCHQPPTTQPAWHGHTSPAGLHPGNTCRHLRAHRAENKRSPHKLGDVSLLFWPPIT